ncbi:MAG: hypothetical protein AAGJ18_27025 [Bacteroidota bacterium]
MANYLKVPFDAYESKQERAKWLEMAEMAEPHLLHIYQHQSQRDLAGPKLNGLEKKFFYQERKQKGGPSFNEREYADHLFDST